MTTPTAPHWHIGSDPHLYCDEGRPHLDYVREFMPPGSTSAVQLARYGEYDDGQWHLCGDGEVYVDAHGIDNDVLSVDDAEQLAHAILRAVAAARG